MNERVLLEQSAGEAKDKADRIKKQYNAKGGLPVFRKGERSRTGAEGGKKTGKSGKKL